MTAFMLSANFCGEIDIWNSFARLSNSVSAAVNGGGELLVSPRASLSAAVNGGGHVRYWGNPSVSMAVHGGGAVTHGS